MAAGAVSFLALGVACAQATHTGDLSSDPLVGGMAGNTAAGGTTAGGGGTAGDTSTATAGTLSAAGSATAGTGGGQPSGGSGGATAGGMAGMGGTLAGAGGTGGGGTAGTGGGGSTAYRYAKLVAISEQSGKVWSSVAELQIMTTGNVAINRAGWTVMADSQETIDQQAPATDAIDGNTATFWHTSWDHPPNDVNDAALPHQLVVDMKTAQPVTGFSYLPRQGDVVNGRIKDWQFFVSKDGTNWGAAVKSGSFPNVTSLQSVVF